jgi:hypothetical protein
VEGRGRPGKAEDFGGFVAAHVNGTTKEASYWRPTVISELLLASFRARWTRSDP